MHIIIDLISSFFLVVLVWYLGTEIPQILGGSAVLTLLCSLFLCISILYKKNQYQISLIVLIVNFTITFNVMSHASVINNMSFWPLIVCILAWSIMFYFIVIRLFSTLLPINPENNEFFEVQDELKRKILHTISSFLFQSIPWIVLTTVVMTPRYYLLELDINGLKISLFHLVLFWIIITLSLALFFLRKINTNIKNCIDVKMITEKSFAKLRIGIGISVFVLLFLGSILEIIRSDWILWCETFLLLVALLMLVRKVVTYSCVASSLTVEESRSLSSKLHFFKAYYVLGCSSIIFVIYTPFLIYFLQHY